MARWCAATSGLATFQLLRDRRNEPQAFLYAFDRLELNGADLRREPIGRARLKRRRGARALCGDVRTDAPSRGVHNGCTRDKGDIVRFPILPFKVDDAGVTCPLSDPISVTADKLFSRHSPAELN
jgi:hypothetical protein